MAQQVVYLLRVVRAFVTLVTGSDELLIKWIIAEYLLAIVRIEPLRREEASR